ncbi:hypothetical protein ACSV4D_11315 [Flavobacterium sp. ARAG 55.4]
MTEKYIESDFVAMVTITKIYPNEKNANSYRADIKINDLFKGEKLKSIYVYGRSDKSMGTSCDIFIPVNTKLVAYARKDSDGNYSVGMCSGLLYLNGRDGKRQDIELEILEVLKSKNIDYTNKTRYLDITNFPANLNQFKGIQLDKKYGIYEITLDHDLKSTQVKEISGFGGDIDDEMIQILSKTKWRVSNPKLKDDIDNNKLLVGVYYYEADKENPSFLSDFYLW